MADELVDLNDHTVTAFVERWRAQSLSTTALTETGRAEVLAGIRRCYRAAGLPAPELVTWVSSPRELRSAVKGANQQIWERLRRIRRAKRFGRLRGIGRSVLISGATLAGGLAGVATAVETELVLAREVRILLGLRSESLRHITDLATTSDLEETVIAIGAVPSLYAGLIAAFVSLAWSSSLPQSSSRNVSTDILNATWRSLSAAEPGDRTVPLVLPAEVARLARSEVWELIWRDWALFGGKAGGGQYAKLIGREEQDLANPPRSLSGYAWCQQRESLVLDDRGRDLLAGLLAARRAAAWIPYRDLVIICEPPRELHTEPINGVRQLHRKPGPAVVWSDDRADDEYYRHGLPVEPDQR